MKDEEVEGESSVDRIELNDLNERVSTQRIGIGEISDRRNDGVLAHSMPQS